MNEKELTVLSVSDDEFIRATRDRVIGTLGLKVVSCHSRDVVQRIEAGSFDLVVLGHSLRDVAARKLAEEIRRRMPDARILLLSRTAFHPTASEFADAVSPPDAPVLLGHIRSILGLPEKRAKEPARSLPDLER